MTTMIATRRPLQRTEPVSILHNATLADARIAQVVADPAANAPDAYPTR